MRSEPIARTQRRFWSKVKIRGPDHCWEWQASTSGGGYGQFQFKGKVCRAHRVAYELKVGPIPAGLKLLHGCDNPPCVNPSHLSPGTMAKNNVDMMERGRHPNAVLLVQCKRGHEFTPENTYYPPYGSRQCRICKRMRDRIRRAI